MKNIKIKDSVSSRTFFFGCSKSRSYICDEQLHSKFLLKGISSDLWHILLSTQSYEKVKEFAKKKKAAESLNEFLCELQESNLIEIKGIIQEESFEQEEQLIDNLKFEQKKSSWLQSNKFLQGLTLQLTYNCNMSCHHCFNDKTFTEEQINFQEAKNIIDQAYELGITELGLTGGECTVNEDFLKIAQYAREKRLSLYVLTNGQTLYDNEELFENFVKLFPAEVKFSLYSMDAKLHDKLTGVKGSHNKTITVMKKLRERKIKTTLNYLQIKDNIGSLHDILEFGKKHSIAVNVTSFFIQNPQNKNTDCRLTIDDLENLCLDKEFPLSVHKRTKTERPPGLRRENTVVCSAATSYLSVNSRLDVLPCNDFNYPLGNLKKQTLENIWNNVVPEFRKTFLKSNLDSECGTHSYCENCLYCPLQASIENGFLKKSTTSCENAIAYTQALRKLKKIKRAKKQTKKK